MKPRPPKLIRALPKLAADVRQMFEEPDALEARAGAVMVIGFFAAQRVDVTAWATREDAAFVTQVAERLYRYDIWRREDGTVRCEWLDEENPQAAWALRFDALVAAGALTREQRNGDFYYGLPEWEAKYAWTPERRHKFAATQARKRAAKAATVVVPPQPVAAQNATIVAGGVCRGCGTTFSVGVGAAGQYCSRVCYENPDRPNRQSTRVANPEPLAPPAPPTVAPAPSIVAPQPSSLRESWWMQSMTREEFDAEAQRRLGRKLERS
jgi:hypothetical protein